MRELPVIKFDLTKPETFGNLAKKLDRQERRTMASDLIELIKVDEGSMSDWLGKAKGYLDQIKESSPDNPDTSEQQGTNEEPPPATEMTLAAVIPFSARAANALLGEPDIAKASEPGGEGMAKWVSSQFRTKDPNWTIDTYPLVTHMSATGLAWRKRDFDDEDRVFHSHFLTCMDVIINKNVRSIERAPRITHQFERYPYEIERSIQRKKWVDFEPTYDEADPQAPKKFYETDCWLDLDGDELDEPWTITLSRDDFPEVVRIRPRWSKKTVVSTKEVLYFNPIRRFYPYGFFSDPDGGFLPMGLGKLLDRTENSADRLLGSIVDTAKTESENGGLMGGTGFALPDKVEVKGNRMTSINTDGMPLDKVVSMFPSKQVSPGSVRVLEMLMQNGERLAGTLNVLDKAPASMSATMARGIIDTGSQIQTAVHGRLVASITQEIRMFVQMADAYDALPEGLMAQDGATVEVTADPHLATEMQRSALAGIYMEMLKAPMVFNPQVVGLRFAQTMRLPNPEELIAKPQAPQLTPDEKSKAVLGAMKMQNDQMKIKAAVAKDLTQALLNMVEAAGGMQNNRAALLTMAQLEATVQQITESAGNVGNSIDGMAQQQPNQNAAALPAPT